MNAVGFREYPVSVGQNDGLVIVYGVDMGRFPVTIQTWFHAHTFRIWLGFCKELLGLDYYWFLSILCHEFRTCNQFRR